MPGSFLRKGDEGAWASGLTGFLENDPHHQIAAKLRGTITVYQAVCKALSSDTLHFDPDSNPGRRYYYYPWFITEKT